MPSYGVYEYFLQHPRNFYAWMEIGAEGAQYFGRLSEKALTAAKNVYKTASLFQIGYGIPFAFKSFRTLYERVTPFGTPPLEMTPTSTPAPPKPPSKTAPTEPKIAPAKAPAKTTSAGSPPAPTAPALAPTVPTHAVKVLSETVPVWIDLCQVVSSVALLTDFGRRQILEQPSLPLMKLAGTVADLVKGSYELYIFVDHWKNKPHAGAPVTEKPSSGFKNLTWDAKSTAELIHRVSFLFLTALSLAPLFKGIDHVSPFFSIFFTTLHLASHIVFYENTPTVVLFHEYSEQTK